MKGYSTLAKDVLEVDDGSTYLFVSYVFVGAS